LQPVPLPIRFADGEDEELQEARTMIDNFALALSHGLMLLAAWRLFSRGDLDDESLPVAAQAKAARPFRKGRPGA
jgi:hypothetical protein